MQTNIDNERVREDIYQSLMKVAGTSPNDHYLASIFSSYAIGISAMPQYLGMEKDEFDRLLQTHFPATAVKLSHVGRQPLDELRNAEYQEIMDLLMSHRAFASESESSIANIVAAGCMGADHLWQDLGLWSRKDLMQMLLHNFTTLAQNNTKNMKWKRFLYKQLCEAEGIYVCRSPSCEMCVDYQVCFAPED